MSLRRVMQARYQQQPIRWLPLDIFFVGVAICFGLCCLALGSYVALFIFAQMP